MTESNTTLYMLDASSLESPTALAADAERRARERGCTCVTPTFRHYLMPESGYCVTIVDHGDACPLGGAK